MHRNNIYLNKNQDEDKLGGKERRLKCKLMSEEENGFRMKTPNMFILLSFSDISFHPDLSFHPGAFGSYVLFPDSLRFQDVNL